MDFPVKVVLLKNALDEEESQDPDDMFEQDEEADHLKQRYHVIGTHEPDWLLSDQDSLIEVNVKLDDDEDDRGDDGSRDDEGDESRDDDDEGDGSRDDEEKSCSSKGSSRFHQNLVASVETLMLADDASVDISGHQAKYEMEVVEQETTRTSIILMPNTQLSDDESDENVEEDKKANTKLNTSQTDLSKSVKHSQIQKVPSADVIQPRRSKLKKEKSTDWNDYGTQTVRHRSTQTNVDQSTQTATIRKIGGVVDHQRNLDEVKSNSRFSNSLATRISNNDHSVMQKLPNSNFDETYNKVIYRGKENDVSGKGGDDVFGSRNFVDRKPRSKMVNFGQQTPSHSSTQTPLLLRFVGNDGLNCTGTVCAFDCTSKVNFGEDEQLFLRPATVFRKDSTKLETTKLRHFSTQTFGQVSNSIDDVQTQTEVSLDRTALHGSSSGRKKDLLKSTDGDSVREVQRKFQAQEKLESRSSNSKVDDSRKELLKLMLDQVRGLRDEVHHDDKKEKHKITHRHEHRNEKVRHGRPKNEIQVTNSKKNREEENFKKRHKHHSRDDQISTNEGRDDLRKLRYSNPGNLDPNLSQSGQLSNSITFEQAMRRSGFRNFRNSFLQRQPNSTFPVERTLSRHPTGLETNGHYKQHRNTTRPSFDHNFRPISHVSPPMKSPKKSVYENLEGVRNAQRGAQTYTVVITPNVI